LSASGLIVAGAATAAAAVLVAGAVWWYRSLPHVRRRRLRRERERMIERFRKQLHLGPDGKRPGPPKE
jgi:hypothetical protein